MTAMATMMRMTTTMTINGAALNRPSECTARVLHRSATQQTNPTIRTAQEGADVLSSIPCNTIRSMSAMIHTTHRSFPLAVVFVVAFSFVWGACDDGPTSIRAGDQTEAPLTLSFAASAGNSAPGARKAAKRRTYTDDANNALTIESAEVVLRDIEFERADADDACSSGDDNDCEEVEEGPILVNLPLDSDQPEVALEAGLPEGKWERVEFDVHKLDDDDADDASFLEETGFPEGVSVRVTGTWTASGGTEQSFVYTSDLNEEQEIEFDPPIDVSADAPKNVTFRVNVDTWFRHSDGTLLNPDEGNDDGRYEELIEENIESSIEGFEDDDRNGSGDQRDDDGDDDGNDDGDDDSGDDDSDDDSTEFDAELRGDQSVPAVQTDADGEVDLEYDRDDGELEYEIELEDIEDVTQAHIHLGGPNENGPVVVTLLRFTENVDGSGDGVPFTPDDDFEEEGTITADDVIARDGFDGSLDALIDAMRQGNAYINVHTVANPSGEIRGQIDVDDDDDGDDD